MEGKALILVRVSTERQEMEAQEKEMIEFVKSEGYTTWEIVKDSGASAIKLNDKYLSMIEEVKDRIKNDTTITCFAVWSLDRVARNEVVFADIKAFLVSHNVQMIIKNPYIKLLAKDGTVDKGMELAVSLLGILAKQEMETKKDRFKRAKKANTEKGKFNGGVVHYGYRLTNNNFFEIDEKEASVIRLIFNLYCTGRYSCYDIAKELNERGYRKKKGTIWTYSSVALLLNDRALLGDSIKYKPIITEEIFNKAAEVMNGNRVAVRHGERTVILSNLIKCPKCRSSFISSGDFYLCANHKDKRSKTYCEQSINIKQELADTAVWNVVKIAYAGYLIEQSKKNDTKIEEEIKIIEEKISNCKEEIASIEAKQKKINISWEEEYYTDEERNSKIANTKKQLQVINSTLANLVKQCDNLNNLKTNIPNDFFFARSLMDSSFKVTDRKEISKIIHIMVRDIEIAKVSQDGRQAVELTINYNSSTVKVAGYDKVRISSKSKKSYEKYKILGNDAEWHILVNIHEVKRD